MPVNSTHADYDENLAAWQRIRDVLAGDTVIKRGGAKYVARLDSQSDDEFRAYVDRGTALMQLRQMDAAMASYDRAIEIRPAIATTG